jgi:hypothetical protein
VADRGTPLRGRLAFRLYLLYLVFASWKSVERELERIGDGVAKKIEVPAK